MYETTKDLCQAIYIKIAKALLHGNEVAKVPLDSLKHRLELMAYGIEIVSTENVAGHLNRSQSIILEGVFELCAKIESTPFNNGRGAKIFRTILQHGYIKSQKQLSDFLTEITTTIESDISSQNQNTRKFQSIKSHKIKSRADRIFDSEISRLAARLKKHLDEIAAPIAASPNRREDVLRKEIGRFIPDVSFENFSLVEIINLVRLAGGIQPINFLADIEFNSGKYGATTNTIEIPPAVFNQINKNLHPRTQLQMESLLQSIKSTAANLSEHLINFLNDAQAYPHYPDFKDGKFNNTAFARVIKSPNFLHADISKAHRELIWLLGDDGRDYLNFLETKIKKLKFNEGTIKFEQFVHFNSTTIFGENYKCQIGLELLNLILGFHGIRTYQTNSEIGANILLVQYKD